MRWPLLVGSLWLLGHFQALRGAEPFCSQSVLFEADRGGYQHYRIPALVVTAKGTLLAFCEARQTTRGDWGTIDIFFARSSDGGRTFSPPRKVAAVAGPHRKNPVALAQKLAAPDAVTYNNPLAIVDRQTGAVHFLFCLEYMRAFYQRSDDDGLLFTPPVEITRAFDAAKDKYPWKVLATGPGHGVQLAGGRLMAPVWLSTGTGGHAHRPSVVATIYSDDHGTTWKLGDVVAGETEPLVNPSEAAVVELTDEGVMLNIRHESTTHRRAVAFSPDGAANWTTPRFDDALVEPICMASMCRLSGPANGERSRLLFANPDNLERADGQAAPGSSRDRKNLSIRLSYDEGRTWTISKALEPGPSAYSDLAVGTDGTIYCLYERGRRDDKTNSKPTLTLARFNLEWLSDGRDSLAAE